MVRTSEKVSLVLRALADPRLKNDIKALKCAVSGYKCYAWELCGEAGIDSLLRKGAAIEEMMKERKIKFRRFLEHVLDFLVGCGVLEYHEGVYTLVNEPGPFTGKELRFLEEFYPNSVKWTNVLTGKAKKTLLTGRKRFDAGFDHNMFLELWDGIMRESPWSFRRLAIRNLCKGLKEGADVLDLGCGSGVSLEQMLGECSKLVNITGMDSSGVSLRKARNLVKLIQKSGKNRVMRENAGRVVLRKHDVLRGIPKDKKYDVVFMSLLLNHVPKDSMPDFFRGVRDILKPGGRAVVYQIIHQSRFERASMWVMHVVPTHHDYPYRDSYISMLKGIFSRVSYYLGGTIVVAER